jgi:hypothetical protein
MVIEVHGGVVLTIPTRLRSFARLLNGAMAEQGYP